MSFGTDWYDTLASAEAFATVLVEMSANRSFGLA
jgi:hypothetical protein